MPKTDVSSLSSECPPDEILSADVLDVCAAVIQRDATVLLAQRPQGKHLAGRWEFPGGKMHPAESQFACIRRELREELGLDAKPVRHLGTVRHSYPNKRIRLHCIECRIDPLADPVHHEGQDSRWVALRDMHSVDLAPADRTVAECLSKQEFPEEGRTAKGPASRPDA